MKTHFEMEPRFENESSFQNFYIMLKKKLLWSHHFYTYFGSIFKGIKAFDLKKKN